MVASCVPPGQITTAVAQVTTLQDPAALLWMLLQVTYRKVFLLNLEQHPRFHRFNQNELSLISGDEIEVVYENGSDTTQAQADTTDLHNGFNGFRI